MGLSVTLSHHGLNAPLNQGYRESVSQCTMDRLGSWFNASGIGGERSWQASGSCAVVVAGTSGMGSAGGGGGAPRSWRRGVGGGHSDNPRTRETKKSLTQK